MQQDGITDTVITNFADEAINLPLSEVCALLNDRVEAFLKRPPTSDIEARVQSQTRISLNVIEEALQRYDLSSLSVSYNGGKDCLVLLILFLSSLHAHLRKTNSPFPSSIPSIYAYPPDPFSSVTSFVESSSKTYHLDLAHIPTNPRPSPSSSSSAAKVSIRDAFESYLRPRPHIRAIFVGTRRTDPHGSNLTFFDPTDHGWPQFMRIHPVIDWKLAEIWGFLRAKEFLHSGVTYCDLYDQGYTSLGGRGDTLPNPLLKIGQGNDEGRRSDGYRPAYELEEDGVERLGRE
ncbi:putative fad [Phaeomoniella chlamydospora]|uniref:FAD synthase n=1 Tax=Phaeomoniella chlamydospora TaxID=158046 RepID=A0A0G2EY27_PHACM|nr:putative fad [Phaeomoniella chlamydospora]